MRPLVVAHRGASGYRPEHTLPGYELAFDMGADFVEVDLVPSREGTLVARHENEISTTTDVAQHPEFADRFTTRVIDGASISGWFTEDFTVGELKRLRANERFPDLRPGNTAYDGRFEIPTLQQVIDLLGRVGPGSERERVVGICLEIKHSTYFQSVGRALEPGLVQVLERSGLERTNVFLLSFEVSNLKYLRATTSLPLVQLVDSSGRPYDLAVNGDPRRYSDLISTAGLAEIASYAEAIGVNKELIAPRDSGHHLVPESTLIRDAHAVGLAVHAWTFRSENFFLPHGFRRGTPGQPGYLRRHGDADREYQLFLAAGIDGIYTDHPNTAARAREVSRRGEAQP